MLSDSPSGQNSRSQTVFLAATLICTLKTHRVCRAVLRSLLSAARKCVRELNGRGQLAPQLLACLGVLSRLRSLLLSRLERPLRAAYRLALRALGRRLERSTRKAIRLSSTADTQPVLFVRRVARRLSLILRFQNPSGSPLSVRVPLPTKLGPLERSQASASEFRTPLPSPREGPAEEDAARERLRGADGANPMPLAIAKLQSVQRRQLSLLPLRALSKRCHSGTATGKAHRTRGRQDAAITGAGDGRGGPSDADADALSPATFAPDELEIALRAESSGLSRAQRKRMRTQMVAALSQTRRT